MTDEGLIPKLGNVAFRMWKFRNYSIREIAEYVAICADEFGLGPEDQLNLLNSIIKRMLAEGS